MLKPIFIAMRLKDTAKTMRQVNLTHLKMVQHDDFPFLLNIHYGSATIQLSRFLHAVS
jgi:hypothetical protein